MAIRVVMPDGSTKSFREGTPKSEIRDLQRIMLDEMKHSEIYDRTDLRDWERGLNQKSSPARLTQFAPQTNTGSKSIGWSTDGGKAVRILHPDGVSETRTGGSVSWRTNNPSNMYQSRSREIGYVLNPSGQRFAIFPDLATGRASQKSMFFEAGSTSSNYPDKTLEEAIRLHSPPGDNPTESYIKYITGATGLSPESKLSTFTPEQQNAFMDAISRFENLEEGRIEKGVVKPLPVGVRKNSPSSLNLPAFDDRVKPR